MHDVIVVGGGPGGLHTATLLAREGFDVLVAEEHRVTGEPVHCTGVMAVEAFAEFDLPRDSILNALATARFVAPSGDSVSHTTPATEAVVIDRAQFDRHLHAAADGAGVRISLGTRISALTVDADGVSALADDGRTFRGRMAVLACGASYRMQRQLGLGMPSVFLQSAQMEIPAAHAGDVEVHFGREVAPRGFAWVVPVERRTGSHARVGLMCDGHALNHFRQFASSVADRWGLQIGDFGALQPRQKMLPLAPIERSYGDRVVAVGDAAGLVKATTGGGIYYSLVSARAAATVIGDGLRRGDLSASTLKRYEKLWRARLGAELRAQLSLRSIADHLDDQDIDALFGLARTNGVMPIVRRTARFNEHRTLIVSLFKYPPVRRLLFKQLVARTAAAAIQ